MIPDTSVADVVAQASGDRAVRVRTPHGEELRELIAASATTIDAPEPGLLAVHGMSSEAIGEAAASAVIVLYELTPQQASLAPWTGFAGFCGYAAALTLALAAWGMVRRDG